jgi:3-dehydroquinate synthase II
MSVVAPDGEIKPGKDFVEMEIRSKADERAAAAAPKDKILVLRMADWTIIPIENLLAQRGNLMVETADAEAARLYRSARDAERSGLRDVARRLWERLAVEHPGSPLAEEARRKL